MDPIEFVIPLPPITKKNSQRIIRRKDGTPLIIPSAQYKQYERDCALFMPRVELIEQPVNLKAVYYMPTRRRVDLTNLLQSTLDILVNYRILADDNSRVIYSLDGSRVDYDKEHPRTEITITEAWI